MLYHNEIVLGLPNVILVSIVTIIGGLMLILAPVTGNLLPHQEHNTSLVQTAGAASLPLEIRDHFKAKKLVGDAQADSSFLEIDHDFVDPENHCEFCMRVEYAPGPQGEAGFTYEDLEGLDFSGAKKVRLWAMGEEGGEEVKFKAAGKSIDKIRGQGNEALKDARNLAKSLFKQQKFDITTEDVKLEKNWKEFEIDLSRADLSDVTHPFGFEVSNDDGKGKKVFYLKAVVFDSEPVEEALALETVEEETADFTAGIIANSTEGIEPLTVEFQANATGGVEPYSYEWDFGNATSSGQEVSHVFESGTHNVTLQVFDSNGQIANASIGVDVEEPEIIEPETTEEPEGNQTLNRNVEELEENLNATSTEDSPAVLGDEPLIAQEDENFPPVAEAGDNIVGYPGDTIILDGSQSSDPNDDEIEYLWNQVDGLDVEMDGENSAAPSFVIPNADTEEEIEIELVVNDGQSKSEPDPITVFIEEDPETDELENDDLGPSESVSASWSTDCDDLAECMSDDSDATFVSMSGLQEDGKDLFEFESFEEEGEIEYIVLQVQARKTGDVGYISFVISPEVDEEGESTDRISISSDSFSNYRFVYPDNPLTNNDWTEEDVNSLIAGYEYRGTNEGSVEISEFAVTVYFAEAEAEEGDQEDEAESVPELIENSLTNSTQAEVKEDSNQTES